MYFYSCRWINFSANGVLMQIYRIESRVVLDRGCRTFYCDSLKSVSTLASRPPPSRRVARIKTPIRRNVPGFPMDFPSTDGKSSFH